MLTKVLLVALVLLPAASSAQALKVHKVEAAGVPYEIRLRESSWPGELLLLGVRTDEKVSEAVEYVFLGVDGRTLHLLRRDDTGRGWMPAIALAVPLDEADSAVLGGASAGGRGLGGEAAAEGLPPAPQPGRYGRAVGGAA